MVKLRSKKSAYQEVDGGEDEEEDQPDPALLLLAPQAPHVARVVPETQTNVLSSRIVGT
jgi:hypothetical protein